MAKGKLILICQFGGEFIRKDDGTMSYEGGEANALNVNQETLFDDLKLELAEMCNLDQKTISIKYFLPGNRRTLISLRNDKDLKRMIDFHGNSVTADVFLSGKEGFDHGSVIKQLTSGKEELEDDVIKKQATRNSRVKKAKTISDICLPPTAASLAVHKTKPLRSRKKTARVNPNPPADSTVEADKPADSSSTSQTDTTSPSSSEHDSASDTEYKPHRARRVDDAQTPTDVDMTCSPADTVKNRRRSASWKAGVHDPTIVADTDNGNTKKRKKYNPRRKSSAVKENSEHQTDAVLEIDDLGTPPCFTFSDDDLPETLIASWKDGITGAGQDFKSLKEFREALQRYAVAHSFAYKLKKNDTNFINSICVEEGCSWNIHASWVPDSKSFRIEEFNNAHTCSGESWKNANLAKNLLVSIIKDKLRESPYLEPKEISKSISQEFGIQLTDAQIWSGVDEAMEQLNEEPYNCLPWFCEKLLETNPGSFTRIMINDEKRLQFLFVTFHSCIQNFQNYCRHILFLDSTSLRSKYQESLLIVTAVDANDGFFPVAFCIVDNENEDSWHWFLEQLKSAISTPRPLTFVSDKEKGLEKPVNDIFENSYQGYSMYHLLESFKRNLKGPYHGEGKGVLPGKFLAAAQSVRIGGFKNYMEQIKRISPDAYEWLNQIEPDHWTRYHFKGERYNYIVENISEPYTKLMDKIQDSTIMQKIESLIKMVNNLIKNCQTESSEWTTKLTPSKEKRLQEEAFKAKNLKVFISSDILFEVHDDSTHVVNIEKWECTCLEWKEIGLLCRHAIACLNTAQKSIYDYCSGYFTVETYRLTYSESINPIPGLGAVVEKEEADISEVNVLPPVPQCPVKKEEDKRTVVCSKCKQPGHNKASCKATLEPGCET